MSYFINMDLFQHCMCKLLNTNRYNKNRMLIELLEIWQLCRQRGLGHLVIFTHKVIFIEINWKKYLDI